MYIGNRTDLPLSPEGVRELSQMREVVEYPEIERLYTSPMLRCKQSANIIYPGFEPHVVEELTEYDFGEFEGKNYADLQSDPRYTQWVEGGCISACPGGESREEFSLRVCAAFEDIVHKLHARGEESATFVVHGGTIMAIMARFALPKKDYFTYQLKNCRGYICDCTVAEDGEITMTILSRRN
jgi:alpha-ribazole phosphatase